MEFKLIFKSPRHAVSMDTKEIGLYLVDLVRLKTGVKNLELSKIFSKVCQMYKDPEVVITEDLARKCELFNDSCTRAIRVPHGFLNKFVEYDVSSSIDDSTGEVISASILYKLNTSSVIEWWESSGFPTEIKE